MEWGKKKGKIKVKSTYFKSYTHSDSDFSCVLTKIDAKYSRYHSFGRLYLSQYKIQIRYQISEITSELYKENDSKSLLAPGFSMPPGIPDCNHPSLCRSSPPGALQNAFPAILQTFLSSPLGERALLFPRSPTFPRNSLAERLFGQIRPFFFWHLSTARSVQCFSLSTTHPYITLTLMTRNDFSCSFCLLTTDTVLLDEIHSEHSHS